MQLDALNATALNNTRKAGIEVLFFNRCTKVGSESMFELLKVLRVNNSFLIDLSGFQRFPRRTLPVHDQMVLAAYVLNLGDGVAYIEHTNWIDNEHYGLPRPIYINLVRDPVERMISWYYYVRNSYKNSIEFRKFPERKQRPAAWYKKTYDKCLLNGDPECQYIPHTVSDTAGNHKRQSLFFCGSYSNCLPFDSPFAIQMAKRNVEEQYAVVGTWEETNVTLAVLEHYIPRFFRNATAMFYNPENMKKIRNRNRNTRKPHISEELKAMVRKNFTHEYEFYHFCRQRLFRQYLALKPAAFP